MRPAVHASILRNRAGRPRPIMRRHSFSLRRLLLLTLVGAVFFIPGIIISIIGLQMSTIPPANKILYQAVGPALFFGGTVVLFCSCVYYYCYGSGESNRLPGGSNQSSINSDVQRHQAHHQYNGHHLQTPHGSVRRSSLKTDQPSPRPSPRLPNKKDQPSPRPSPQKEKQVLLATSEFTSEKIQHSPPPTIQVDQASETGEEHETQDREHLINGEVPHNDPSPV